MSSLSASSTKASEAIVPARIVPGESDALLEPAVGYDQAAGTYDEWHWQRFWCRNETPFVTAVLASLSTGEALDVGTGTGRYVGILRELGHETRGIDVSGRMLEKASAYLGGSRGLVYADLRAAPFPNASFDLLTCCRVLSHVRDLDAALAEFRRLVRPGGRVIITDVDSRHDYVATRIPVGDRNIFIKVHKHSVQDLTRVALAMGFRPIIRRSFVSSELPWHPTPDAFPAIDWSGKRPVLSLLVLEA